jgi:hypothetical protein
MYVTYPLEKFNHAKLNGLKKKLQVKWRFLSCFLKRHLVIDYCFFFLNSFIVYKLQKLPVKLITKDKLPKLPPNSMGHSKLVL